MISSQDASFRHLIESFPRILLLPKESHMKHLMVFLDDIGVVEGCKRQILILFPPIIFYDIEKDVRPRLLAILKVSDYLFISDLTSSPSLLISNSPSSLTTHGYHINMIAICSIDFC